MTTGSNTDTLAQRLGVYLVADPDQTSGEFLQIVATALAAGVTAVQLRTKERTDRQSLVLGKAIADSCREVGALFIVNDRLDLALILGADGVHLGVDDIPVREARRVTPVGFVIGFSPETDEQAKAAGGEGADYLGVGPVYGSASKLDAGAAIGIATIRHRAALAGIPVIGIGGITPENAAPVVAAGAVGVAVVGAIMRAAKPDVATRELLTAVASARTTHS